MAAAEQRAKLEAQQHAQVLLKRTRVLRAVLALVVIVAVAAVFGFGWALKARRDAACRFRDATALRLYGDSQLKLAGLSPGGSDDVAGMQMLLAAYKMPSTQQGRKYELLTALHQERDLLKVIDVPAVVSSVAFSPDGTRIASASVGQHGPVVGRRHRAAHRGAAARPRQHGDQRGVQPRRRPDRLGQRGQDRPVVGRRHRAADRGAAAPRQRGDERGVQPRRHPPRLRQAATRPSGCGTPPPGSRSGNRCAATTTW